MVILFSALLRGKSFINKIFLEIIYMIYMYKKDFALNNQQWLIWHKTKPILGSIKWKRVSTNSQYFSKSRLDVVDCQFSVNI